jgi:hypothetical protein
MLSYDNGTYNKSEWIDHKSVVQEEYEYWYRVINDGRAPVDSLPYYRTYLSYKQFVDTIEEKALNTLKQTITRLLLDF